MPGCVLRVKGAGIDVDSFLREAGWENARRFEDGFNVVISDADDWNDQTDQAEEFISQQRRHMLELVALTKHPPVINFGAYRSDSASQSFSCSPELVNLIGELGLELELSLYASDIE